MPVGRAVRHRQKFRLHIGKIAGGQRAECREWTARENEIDRQRPALELRRAEFLAELVGKIIFRHRVAHVQRLEIADKPDVVGRRQKVGLWSGLADLIDPAVVVFSLPTPLKNRVELREIAQAYIGIRSAAYLCTMSIFKHSVVAFSVVLGASAWFGCSSDGAAAADESDITVA